jgi:hypothetical protein
METSTPVFPNGRVGTTHCSGAFVEVPACAAVKALKGTSADPKPASPAALMKSRLERIFFSPDMFDISSQWIGFGSGFKGLGILTLEGIW